MWRKSSLFEKLIMDFFSTLTLLKLRSMTKVDAVVSSIPWIIVTRHDLCNDDIPSDSLLPSGTCIDVVLDVTVENTTLNKGDVPNEGKVSNVTLSKLQIQRKITHMRSVNVDRSKWLPENWRF